jgi:hypothetical protein
MSAAVDGSRSITSHSVAGESRIAFTRAIRRSIAAEDSEAVPGEGGAGATGKPGGTGCAEGGGVDARFAPQFPQNFASSAIVAPHFGQIMAIVP